MWKRISSIFGVTVLAVGVLIILKAVNKEPSDGKKATATPTVTVAVTEVVTPGPGYDVDTELFWNIFTDYFPKESLKRASEKNSKASFAGRIELSEEEWDKTKPKLNFDDWYLKEYPEPQKSSLFIRETGLWYEKQQHYYKNIIDSRRDLLLAGVLAACEGIPKGNRSVQSVYRGNLQE